VIDLFDPSGQSNRVVWRLEILGQAELGQQGFRMEKDLGAIYPERKPDQATAMIIMSMADHDRLGLFLINA